MGALFEALTRQPLLDFGSLGRSLAAGNAADCGLESKWYQQAAAIGEKHKVSLSLLFLLLFFVCFCGLFFFGVCFFGLFFVCFFFIFSIF